jgi:hypothetical protein
MKEQYCQLSKKQSGIETADYSATDRVRFAAFAVAFTGFFSFFSNKRRALNGG